MFLLFKELGYIYIKKDAHILSIIKKFIFAHGCSYHITKHTPFFLFCRFQRMHGTLQSKIHKQQ